MDLKKLFVYVKTADYAAFKSTVLDDNTKWADYANKIVFIEKTNQIWVKGEYYGTDLETLESRIGAIWTALGFAEADGVTAGSYTVNGSTYNYNDLKTWIEALKNYSDGKDAVVQANAYAQSAADSAVVQANAYAQSAADSAAAQANAYAKIEAVETAIVNAYTAADSAIITAYEAADQAIITAYQNADSAIITAYQNADSAIITSYQAADAALEAKLPGVAVSGSGLSLQTSTDEVTGKTTYTIVADQSIWEFMGTASATAATVATVLNGKYGEGEGQVHREKEAGDVWAVTITDHQPQDTVLYAYDGSAWVLIGSAQGVSGVDTTAHNGIALTNVASVVGLSVTPGSIADGDTSVITGGTAYTKFAEVISAYEAADTAIITSYEAADQAIITAYQNADAAINAEKTKSIVIDSADASYASIASTNDANGYAYTISISEQGLFNFVSDNIWEEYSAS